MFLSLKAPTGWRHFTSFSAVSLLPLVYSHPIPIILAYILRVGRLDVVMKPFIYRMVQYILPVTLPAYRRPPNPPPPPDAASASSSNRAITIL